MLKGRAAPEAKVSIAFSDVRAVKLDNGSISEVAEDQLYKYSSVKPLVMLVPD